MFAKSKSKADKARAAAARKKRDADAARQRRERENPNRITVDAPPPAAAPEPKAIVETTGGALLNGKLAKMEKDLASIEAAGGGVYFVDEAYTLAPWSSSVGRELLDFLLPYMEDHRETLVVVLAGYSAQMDRLFMHNEGLPSRFPKTLMFPDFSDALMLEILMSHIKTKSDSLPHCDVVLEEGEGEGGETRWARVSITRIAKGRGRVGFGNGRAVRNLFEAIWQRHKTRVGDGLLSGADVRRGATAVISKEDCLGPRPQPLARCPEWAELERMIGLGGVKEALRNLAELVERSRVKEDMGRAPDNVPLNRVFLGNPGTGKTSVRPIPCPGTFVLLLTYLAITNAITRPSFFCLSLGGAPVWPHLGSSGPAQQRRGVLQDGQ